ncbi:MAG: hypothetical protein WCJ51_01195 [Candidatus Moraniibacteriota bacterium]
MNNRNTPDTANSAELLRREQMQNLLASVEQLAEADSAEAIFVCLSEKDERKREDKLATAYQKYQKYCSPDNKGQISSGLRVLAEKTTKLLEAFYAEIEAEMHKDGDLANKKALRVALQEELKSLNPDGDDIATYARSLIEVEQTSQSTESAVETAEVAEVPQKKNFFGTFIGQNPHSFAKRIEDPDHLSPEQLKKSMQAYEKHKDLMKSFEVLSKAKKLNDIFVFFKDVVSNKVAREERREKLLLTYENYRKICAPDNLENFSPEMKNLAEFSLKLLNNFRDEALAIIVKDEQVQAGKKNTAGEIEIPLGHQNKGVIWNQRAVAEIEDDAEEADQGQSEKTAAALSAKIEAKIAKENEAPEEKSEEEIKTAAKAEAKATKEKKKQISETAEKMYAELLALAKAGKAGKTEVETTAEILKLLKSGNQSGLPVGETYREIITLANSDAVKVAEIVKQVFEEILKVAKEKERMAKRMRVEFQVGLKNEVVKNDYKKFIEAALAKEAEIFTEEADASMSPEDAQEKALLDELALARAEFAKRDLADRAALERLRKFFGGKAGSATQYPETSNIEAARMLYQRELDNFKLYKIKQLTDSLAAGEINKVSFEKRLKDLYTFLNLDEKNRCNEAKTEARLNYLAGSKKGDGVTDKTPGEKNWDQMHKKMLEMTQWFSQDIPDSVKIGLGLVAFAPGGFAELAAGNEEIGFSLLAVAGGLQVGKLKKLKDVLANKFGQINTLKRIITEKDAEMVIDFEELNSIFLNRTASQSLEAVRRKMFTNGVTQFMNFKDRKVQDVLQELDQYPQTEFSAEARKLIKSFAEIAKFKPLSGETFEQWTRRMVVTSSGS